MSADNMIFEPAPIVTVPIKGSDQLFPVRRIYCVGQNYADHTKEMGGTPGLNKPVFFSKPADAIVPPTVSKVHYPPKTSELHHEVELVVALGKGGKNIGEYAAFSHIFGYAIGVDLTRRDKQAEAKAKGMPWDLAKGFDESAPISHIYPVATVGQRQQGFIKLRVNGRVKQESDLSLMMMKVAKIIAELSSEVTLAAGDLIFTGTPAGVGPLQRGDKVDAAIEGLGDHQFEMI
ncbi:MAG: fumarylacetoacetate hydrolase family protein [Alphaproteobacteria bacterium]